MKKIIAKAWDIKNCKMLPITAIYDDMSCRVQDGATNRHLSEKDSEIFLYTNLNDRNDTKIYNDDIVEYNSKQKQRSKVWQDKGGEWKVYDSVKDEILELYMEKRFLTVIGNMSENKELLICK